MLGRLMGTLHAITGENTAVSAVNNRFSTSMLV
jgi:hypothetical protein